MVWKRISHHQDGRQSTSMILNFVLWALPVSAAPTMTTSSSSTYISATASASATSYSATSYSATSYSATSHSATSYSPSYSSPRPSPSDLPMFASCGAVCGGLYPNGQCIRVFFRHVRCRPRSVDRRSLAIALRYSMPMPKSRRPKCLEGDSRSYAAWRYMALT